MDLAMRARPFASIACSVMLGALLACAAAPARAQFIDVIPDGGSPRYLPLPPGGSTTFSFALRNPGTLVVEGDVGGELQGPAAAFGDYTFVAQQPSLCGTPVLEPRTGYAVLRFPLTALAPGETRACAYTVQRAPGSTSDLGFRTCWLPLQGRPGTPFCGRVARLGTLPDLELALDTLGPAGDGVTLLRLRLLNRAPVDVAGRVATTGCYEFDGGPAEPTRFDIDGNLPGGCPAATGFGCLGGTGTAYSERAFQLGPVAAGGSSACLLRVRTLRENGLPQVRLLLQGDAVTLPAGAVGFDPMRERETVWVGVGLPGAEPVPLGTAVPGAIALLLLAGGLGAVRARMRQAQSA